MSLISQAWLEPLARRLATEYLEDRHSHGRYPRAYVALIEERFAEGLFREAEAIATVIDSDDPLHEFLEEERLDAAVERELEDSQTSPVSAGVSPPAGTTSEGRRA